MSQAALLVACFSLIVSGLALGWQVAMWLLNGGRVKAHLRHGVVGRGGVASGPVHRDGRRRDIASLRSQGWEGPEVLGVQVINTGRARVQVTAFGIRQGGQSMSINYPSSNAFSPALPAWIEPGSSETWYAAVDDGTALIAAAGHSSNDLRMTITLGTGKSVVTRHRLTL